MARKSAAQIYREMLAENEQDLDTAIDGNELSEAEDDNPDGSPTDSIQKKKVVNKKKDQENADKVEDLEKQKKDGSTDVNKPAVASVKKTEKVTAEEFEIDDIKIDVSEDIDAMFSDEDLSEEAKERITTIFEAAIRKHVKAISVQLAEQAAEKLSEAKEEYASEIENDVDRYVTYAVNEWIEENKLAIDSGIRTEIAESFMQGLANLFEEHYVDVPESKVDLVEELSNKLEEVESKLDEQTTKNIDLQTRIFESEKQAVVAEHVKDMSDAQAEKFKTLVEDVSADNIESFAKKVKTLHESYVKDPKGQQDLHEEVLEEGATRVSADPAMEKRLAYLRGRRKSA